MFPQRLFKPSGGENDKKRFLTRFLSAVDSETESRLVKLVKIFVMVQQTEGFSSRWFRETLMILKILSEQHQVFLWCFQTVSGVKTHHHHQCDCCVHTER